MMRNRMQTAVKWAVSVAALFVVWAGCSEKIVDSRSGGGNVELNISALPASPSLISAVDMVIVTVTAPDMDTIMDTTLFTGGVITIELEVPAGRERVIQVQAVDNSVTGAPGLVVYTGHMVVDITPEDPVRVPIIMRPAVPLVRLVPHEMVIPAGESFQLDLEVFNLPGLQEARVWITDSATDYNYYYPDSASKGGSIGPADYFHMILGGDGMYTEIQATGVNEIADASGYCHLASLFYTTPIIVDTGSNIPYTVYFSTVPQAFASTTGNTIPNDTAYAEQATVELILPLDRVVTFPDSVLERAVIDAAYSQGDSIMLSDVLGIWSLYAAERGVTDLTGISTLSNLNYADLSVNSISDLTPLRGMTSIETLNLTYNLVADIAPLASLSGLHYLYLANNSVSDLSPLLEIAGFGSGIYDTLDVRYNPLSTESKDAVIPELISRGVGVAY
ncbi:MAG: hypothetical protein JSU65_12875 [Candidatus Zixiibacteriota bacterium]|nr:MAG: hypothetical protein JSU65_12875 [candidate division Zixibacteria bacterium]